LAAAFLVSDAFLASVEVVAKYIIGDPGPWVRNPSIKPVLTVCTNFSHVKAVVHENYGVAIEQNDFIGRLDEVGRATKEKRC